MVGKNFQQVFDVTDQDWIVLCVVSAGVEAIRSQPGVNVAHVLPALAKPGFEVEVIKDALKIRHGR